MQIKEFFIYLIIMAGSTYLIRAIPFVVIKEKIKNNFIKSFLYYIPYTVLMAMTFPAALYVTGHLISAVIGLLAACLLALKNKGLTLVAVVTSVVVLVCELIIMVL
ncbi:MAG: AzlD domain-containing protein [Bacilli bacterium]|nr:AzlD domain-containing protein [Bacilli bacterium]